LRADQRIEERLRLTKREKSDAIDIISHVIHKYMRKHGLSPEQFLEADEKYHIIDVLLAGYRVNHMTGDDGVLEELESHIAGLRGR
jgi:hypothetical protein